MVDFSKVKSNLNELDVFRLKYPNLTEEHIRRKAKFKSCFKDEKTPSFNFKYGGNGEIRFNCFSTGKNGDVLTFYKEINNFSNLPEAVKHLADRFNIKTGNNEKKNTHWKAEYKTEHNDKSMRYWKAYGITLDALNRLGVKQVSKIKYTDKNGKVHNRDYDKEGLSAFEFSKNGRKKLYVPLTKNKAYKFPFQTCVANDLFGGTSHKYGKAKFGVLVEGEKDVLTLVSHGFTAYCLQSANVGLTKENYRKLKSVASEWIIFYDNDPAGKNGAFKISKKWNIPIYHIDESDINDVSDWFKSKKNKDAREGLANTLKEQFNRTIENYKLYNNLNVWESDNTYKKLTIKRDKNGEEISRSKIPVSNFILSNSTFIEGNNNQSQRIISLQSPREETDLLAITTDILTSKSTFQKFIESRGDFHFFGTEKDLSAIKFYTFSNAEKVREIAQMGYDSRANCFVLSNAIIKNNHVFYPNKYGIINGIYIPSANQGNRFNTDFGEDRKYIFQENTNVDLAYFFNTLSSCYNNTAAIIGLAHLIATLYYDIIVDCHFKLPLLNIHGQKGSGKNSFIELLLSVFGRDPNLTHLGNSTPNKISRVMSHTVNIPQWFDEFKTSMNRYRDKVEVMKGFYDRTGRGRATTTNDTKTKQDKISTSAIITGQDSIKDEALLSRLVTLHFATVRATKEEKKRFIETQSELKKGAGQVLVSLLSYRAIIKDALPTKVNNLLEHFSDAMIQRDLAVNTRLLQNYAVLFAPIIIAMENGLKLFKDNGKTDNANNIKDLLNIVVDNIELQNKDEETQDEVSVFWEVFLAMIERGRVSKGNDFIVENEAVFINTFVFEEYEKYHREQYNESGLSRLDLIRYLKTKSYYKGDIKKSFEQRQADLKKKQKKCHQCDLRKFPKELRERMYEQLI